jgi:hypothetical protein
LVGSNGAPISGYTISFDDSTTLVTTSNGQGQFTLVVPVTAVTGHDDVVIKDTTGAIVSLEPVSLSSTVSSTVTLGTLTPTSPPSQPSI